MDDATQKLVDGLRLDARDYGRKMRGEVPPEELISWDQSNVRAWEAADALEATQRPFPVDGAPMGGHPSEAVQGTAQPVTPDREPLAKALMGIGWSGWLGAPDTFFLGWADALLASGVLGQPRDVEPVTDEALWDFANDLTDAWNIEDENPPSLVEQFRDLFVARFGVLGQPQPQPDREAVGRWLYENFYDWRSGKAPYFWTQLGADDKYETEPGDE